MQGAASIDVRDEANGAGLTQSSVRLESTGEAGAREWNLLGVAGAGRNIGYGANKIFTGPMLQAFGASQVLIGLALGAEGLFGVVLSPLTGWISDRTTRPGWRRRIYVRVAVPGAGLAWLLFYYAHSPLVATALLLLFYFFQQAVISPYQAWMPEVTEPASWGPASGTLNAWWQGGNMFSFIGVPLVYEISHAAGFWLVFVLMAAGGAITSVAVKEPPAPVRLPARTPALRTELRAIFRGDLLLLLITLTLVWLSFESAASFFTLDLEHAAHGTLFDAALCMALYNLVGIGAALLFGRLYKVRSPRRMLWLFSGLYGIVMFAGVGVHSVALAFAFMPVAGVLWAGIQTVGFALTADLLRRAVRDEEQERAQRGLLYGIFNLAPTIGLLLAAPVAGAVIALMHGFYPAIFIVAGVSALLAAVAAFAMRANAAAPA